MRACYKGSAALVVLWIRPLGAGLVLIVSRDFGTSASLYANLHHLARSQ